MAFKFNWINDFRFNVQRGVSAKYDIRNPEGQNESIGTTAETIWTPGDDYPFQDTAAAITVVSTSNDDAIAGTGLQKLELKMLDTDGIEQAVIVDMNGTTPVAVPGTFKAVNSCIGIQGGSGKFNVGVITVVHNATDTVAQIEVNKGKALQAVYTVPSDKKAFAFAGYFTSANMDNSIIQVLTREPGSIWVASRIQYVNQSAAQLVLPFNELSSGSQLQLTGKSLTASVALTAGFSLLLKKN